MPVNHTIAVDWFESNFSIKNPDLFGGISADLLDRLTNEKTSGKALPLSTTPVPDKVCIGKTVFKKTGYGNKFLREKYTIWHGGQRYGTMLCGSPSPLLTPMDRVQIKVINNKLYEEDWLDTLKLLSTQAEMKFENFTRLDIAIDGGSHLRLFSDWFNHRIEKIGRAKMNPYVDSKRGVEGFNIGKAKSKKKVTVYNKSKELEVSHKGYITRFWDRSGLPHDSPVERVELRLRNEEAKKFDDIRWDELDQPAHLASIMKANLAGFFEWTETSKDKNVSRRKRIETINWDELNATYLDKDSTRPTNEIWAGKVTVKKLFEIHQITQMQFWFDAAFEIAQNMDCISWFNKMAPLWITDLKSKMGDNSDGEISDSWITNFKSYKLNEQIVIFDKYNEPSLVENMISN